MRLPDVDEFPRADRVSWVGANGAWAAWQAAAPYVRSRLCQAYSERHGQPPNLANPGSYTEILFKHMLSAEGSSPLRQFVTDKEHVKVYVAAVIGDAYNVATHGILRTRGEIAAYAFPARCVVKPTHLSGAVIARRGAEQAVDCATIERWLAASHYLRFGEANYRYLEPKIIVEELLEAPGGGPPRDYKFYCFHGRPALLQVDFDRLGGGHRRAYYSIRWERLPCADNEAALEGAVPPPAQLEELVEVARRLSSAFAFIRVDLYVSSDGIKVGELTNFPAGCREPFRPPEVDRRMGRLFAEPDLDVVKLLSD